MRETYWDSKEINELFRLCVGKTYGDSPADHIEEIRKVKKHEADNLDLLLHFLPNDTVVDLGSGCGFIAKNVAARVKTLYCLDINSGFLDYCRRETADCTNVQYQQIKYADLSCLANVSVDVIYSTALFIHFNLYDIYHYLKSCYNTLRVNGRMVFDFLDATTLDINSDLFSRHSQRYLENCNNLFTNVYWNDLSTVKSICQQIGFDVVDSRLEDTNHFLVLKKL